MLPTVSPRRPKLANKHSRLGEAVHLHLCSAGRELMAITAGLSDKNVSYTELSKNDAKIMFSYGSYGRDLVPEV